MAYLGQLFTEQAKPKTDAGIDSTMFDYMKSRNMLLVGKDSENDTLLIKPMSKLSKPYNNMSVRKLLTIAEKKRNAMLLDKEPDSDHEPDQLSDIEEELYQKELNSILVSDAHKEEQPPESKRKKVAFYEPPIEPETPAVTMSHSPGNTKFNACGYEPLQPKL